MKHDACSEFFFLSLLTIIIRIKIKHILKLRFLEVTHVDFFSLALVTSDGDVLLRAAFARYRRLTRALKQNYFG